MKMLGINPHYVLVLTKICLQTDLQGFRFKFKIVPD